MYKDVFGTVVPRGACPEEPHSFGWQTESGAPSGSLQRERCLLCININRRLKGAVDRELGGKYIEQI